jgi:hypothetical protein
MLACGNSKGWDKPVWLIDPNIKSQHITQWYLPCQGCDSVGTHDPNQFPSKVKRHHCCVKRINNGNWVGGCHPTDSVLQQSVSNEDQIDNCRSRKLTSLSQFTRQIQENSDG